MYDLGCMWIIYRDPSWYSTDYRGLYGLKYDSAITCGLPLYLCSYKLVGSVTLGIKPKLIRKEIDLEIEVKNLSFEI